MSSPVSSPPPLVSSLSSPAAESDVLVATEVAAVAEAEVVGVAEVSEVTAVAEVTVVAMSVKQAWLDLNLAL